MRIMLDEIAQYAVKAEFAGLGELTFSGALWETDDGYLQEAFHIVIDVIPDGGPAVLVHEQSYRGGVSGDYNFIDIAHSKCSVSVRTGKDTRDVPVEDRLPGETEYWGSIVRPLIFAGNCRLVLAGSGYRSEIDEVICERVYLLMMALIDVRVRAAREEGDTSKVLIVF